MSATSDPVSRLLCAVALCLWGCGSVTGTPDASPARNQDGGRVDGAIDVPAGADALGAGSPDGGPVTTDARAAEVGGGRSSDAAPSPAPADGPAPDRNAGTGPDAGAPDAPPAPASWDSPGAQWDQATWS